MRIVVAILGVLVVLIGLLGLVSPGRFRAVLAVMTNRARFLAAIYIRVGLGVFLWLVADELRFPYVMRIIAAISLFAAVAILIMGRERLNQLVDWWLARPDGLLRLSILFAALFGGFLVYVAT